MLDLEELELLGYIQKLQLKGYEVQNTGNCFKLSKQPKVRNTNYKLYEGNLKEIKIGIVSDTHIGSKQQQETLLNYAYNDFEERGITTVLHCGDITDGLSNRPEHKYELFALGADEQAEYVINNYPEKKGIKTYFICGNHDGWHFKNGGFDIGKKIDSAREDMVYLGSQQATVIINNCKIRLFHPIDGSSYAYSYSGQKTMDAIRGGEKPNIMLVGHHHKQMYFVYRNIHYFEVPSFQAETPFIQGKRLSNDVGYWILNVEVDDLGNVIKMKPELTVFYKTIENDYQIKDNRPTTKVLKIK
jgi:predicted phosphodiesterase